MSLDYITEGQEQLWSQREKRSVKISRTSLVIIMTMNILFLLVKITILYGLTCDEVIEFPTEKKLSLVELQSIPPKDIVMCLAHLGKERMPISNAEFIWQSIIQFYDGIVNIPDQVLGLLHWVTVAVKPEDYTNITLSNIDVIQNFGLNYNLGQSQLLAIADRVREDFAGKEPEDYTNYDLTALGQILCAFNKSEIERIHPSAYKAAASVIGKLQHCSSNVMTEFAKLAIHKYAFGRPEKWSEITTKIVGKVAEYLPKELAEKLNNARQNPV